MRHLIATALLLSTTTSGLALDNQWGSGLITKDWYYASYTIDKKTITLYCTEGVHEFIYDMPAALLDPSYSKLDSVDLVMTVDGRGEETVFDNVKVARALVEITADTIAFRLEGEVAWKFQGGVGYSDYITVAVSQLYRPEAPKLDQLFTLKTRNAETEYAVQSVLTPCTPKEPEPEPSPIRPQ